MPRTEAEPILNIKTKRFDFHGRTMLEVRCPELNFGMGHDVEARGDLRLIDCFLQVINENVTRLAASEFIDPDTSPEVLKTARRIHELMTEGIPLSHLFKHS